MNIGTFLDLKRKYNSSLTKENLFLITFAFLYTLITLFIIFAVFFWYKSLILESSILQVFYKLENLIFYPATILLFLIFFCIGIKGLSKPKHTYSLWFKKFNMKCKDCTYNNFKKFFNFQGALKNSYEDEKQKCLYLRYSSEGLITKRGFNNFMLSFDAKIFYSGFGIILCAKDLENYFMLRVNFDEKDDNSGKLFIVPHIRKHGVWEIQKIDNDIKTIKNGELFNFFITNKNGLIKLIIKNKNDQLVKKFEYSLPNYFPLIQPNNKELFKNIVPKVEFPKFGKVGFRACGSREQAIIYNLKIENIKNNI